jgi:oxygen-independent coproporphyrinogen-3 oxidase
MSIGSDTKAVKKEIKMAGIYIHIPYCRQACRYCDFHFVVSVWQKKELMPFILREIEERKDYLENERIDSIYFGGGTPSVLESAEIENILETIYLFYPVSAEAEISFEANPEDLKKEYLKNLKKSGINRLSIGIQSFQDSDLELMHRIHNADQAISSVNDALEIGFDNISIDLIYGIPRQEPGVWKKNLETALSLGIQHFSAYHLTYEPGTIFDHWRKKGRINPVPEEDSISQFKLLINSAIQKGFEHYEISNFALPGYYSQHNSGYWQQKKYMGIGPSAHSYNSESRRWNFSNNKKYIENFISGSDYFETEILTPDDLYNEFVMTSLRMMRGITLGQIKDQFGEKKAEYFKSGIKKFESSGHVVAEQGVYRLEGEGILIADHIIAGVFI